MQTFRPHQMLLHQQRRDNTLMFTHSVVCLALCVLCIVAFTILQDLQKSINTRYHRRRDSTPQLRTPSHCRTVKAPGSWNGCGDLHHHPVHYPLENSFTDAMLCNNSKGWIFVGDVKYSLIIKKSSNTNSWFAKTLLILLTRCRRANFQNFPCYAFIKRYTFLHMAPLVQGFFE